MPKAILARKNGLEFATVTEAAKKHQPVAVLHCPHVMSWADEERDVTAWLGNELQNEAFSKLYAQKEKVAALKNPDFDYVWSFMQTSDHFYYMATKWLSDGDVHSYFNPYDSAYDAFINYMNVLSDFIIELDKAVAAKAAKNGPDAPTDNRKTGLCGGPFFYFAKRRAACTTDALFAYIWRIENTHA